MKLTIFDINILMDTLKGSLSISDGGLYWHFNFEVRKRLYEKLVVETDNEILDITIGDKS